MQPGGKEPHRSRKRAYAAARVLVGFALLFYLVQRLDMGKLREVFTHASMGWGSIVAGVFFTFLGLLAGALRWQEILAVQGLRPTTSHVFSIFFIGQFFNAFMLGGCGGDVARAYYISIDRPGRRAEAASTVFVDRAVGLFVMIVFCCAMIALRIPLFLDNVGTRGPGVLMFFFLIGSLVALVALFRRNLFEHWPFFQRLEKDSRIGSLIGRTYHAFYLYRSHHRVMLVALVFSLLNLAFLTLACYSFGRGLQAGMTLLDTFTLFPIISVIAAVPITPGSLGVREGLFVAMFGAVGIDAHYSLAVSLLVYLGGVLWSLFGGLVFLGYSAGSGHTLRQDLDAVANRSSPP